MHVFGNFVTNNHGRLAIGMTNTWRLDLIMASTRRVHQNLVEESPFIYFVTALSITTRIFSSRSTAAG